MMRFFRIFCLAFILTLGHFSPAQGESLPDSAFVTGIAGHAQGYSLSCESRSAADWAAYWGVRISEKEFLDALPKADNPEQGFVGSPNDAWGSTPPNSYGVHAGPVADTLRGFGLEAVAHNGLTWDDLRAEIEAGRPVIVWVIGQMSSGTPTEYVAPDGSTSVVAPFEHTMILTGYSPDSVQVVDAYSGQYQSYWLKTFLKSWGVLGNMAVFGPGDVQKDAEPETRAQGGTYTVKSGEYLVELAERFGTTWQELAELNSIGFPFTIFTGQVLQLPGTSGAETEPEPESTPEPTPPPAAVEYSYKAVLPLIQRNYIDPNPPSILLAPPAQSTAETIIVRHTETLLNFGRNVRVDWRVLAKLNGLQPPYLLLPGQVVKLK